MTILSCGVVEGLTLLRKRNGRRSLRALRYSVNLVARGTRVSP